MVDILSVPGLHIMPTYLQLLNISGPFITHKLVQICYLLYTIDYTRIDTYSHEYLWMHSLWSICDKTETRYSRTV